MIDRRAGELRRRPESAALVAWHIEVLQTDTLVDLGSPEPAHFLRLLPKVAIADNDRRRRPLKAHEGKASDNQTANQTASRTES
ncbi:hypothetical protein [Pseudodonghicola xiamenensis]|uniref:hypothetical protein n=1 Tax=Pseudodonghicola xiamenensis TaxID=337702 RepID=UPI000483E3B4|nr:hypothetical protein [Pseudodonghicola xiamenensis]